MTLDDLICKTECQELIFEHARHLDEMKIAESRNAFSDDAIMVTPLGDEVRIADMPEAETRRVATNLKPRIVTNVVVKPTGPDTADGFAYITLPRKLVAQGEWHYKFRKFGKDWKITWYRAIGLEREKGEFEELKKQALAARAAAQKAADQ